ncbi:MAG: hypothetical protein JJT88_12460 [Gammaproteobacteria bacterium]|nr:hypothetical protein [Gammaproteobacteria bacterium]
MFDSYLMLLRQVRQVWRHRLLAAVVAFVAAFGGWFAVAQMPDLYRADTRLYVDTASMLNRLLAGVAMDSSEVDQEFLRLAQRSLLTRPNLERIARETDMDIQAVTPQQRERMLSGLASQIRVRAESTQRRGQENLFQLSYEHPDPDHALRVVRAVHDVFIESVLGLTRRDTEKMDVFLDRQIAHYEERLEAAEEQRKRFRQENAGLLPGEGQNYFSMLHAARERLREAELNLTRSQRMRDDLQQQVAALPGGAAGPLLAEPGSAAAMPASTVAQIRSLEQRLAELEMSYTDQHPDVVATRRQLERLRGPDGEIPAGSELDTGSGDAIADRFRLQDLRAELARAQAAVASERASVEEYRRRMHELEGAVNTIPQVEAEMARLNRDYNIVRQQYEQLVSRRESARMSREADLTVDEGIFQVIEPPHVTTRPVAPNRPRLATAVLGGAFALSGGLALLLSLVRPTFGDVGQLRDGTGLHVLGRVGIVRSRREQFRRMLSFAFYGVVLLILLGIYAALILRYA